MNPTPCQVDNHPIYDALGRPTAYNQATEGQTYLMSCTYNKAGMVVDETYPSNKVMHSEYDDAGRPAGVKKTTNSFYYAGAVATDAANRVQYSAHGAMSVMKLGNGLWEHANFNSRLQPTQIGLGSGQTSSSVLGLDYPHGVLVGGSLDATKNNGNLQSQTITVPGASFVQSYGYDQVNRLTSVQEKYNAKLIWTQTCGFDQWGNRTSLVNSGSKAPFLPTQSTPAVDSTTNRLAGASYDAAGNYLSVGGAVTYDAENRLALLREPGALRFKYDGDGRRVGKINDDAGPEIIVFVYNAAGRMVAEYSSTAGSLPNVKVSYLTADHLSSTRVVTDGTGALVARHDYLPYGEEMPALVARTGIAGYGAADGIRQKFTQKERDSESGLDYFLARYYSSAQGRFMSPDAPFADQSEDDPQSWNLYVYVRSNPLRFIDPTGMWHYEETEIHGIKYRIVVGDYDNEYVKGVGYWNSKTHEWGKYHDWTPGLSSFSRLVFLDLARRETASIKLIDIAANITLTPISIISGTGVFRAGIYTLAKGAAEASAIKVTAWGLAHVLARHVAGGAKTAGKSLFHGGEAEVVSLIREAGSVARVAQPNGNFARVVDAGRIIGVDRVTGAPTSVYTVITDAAERLVTAFPGKP